MCRVKARLGLKLGLRSKLGLGLNLGLDLFGDAAVQRRRIRMYAQWCRKFATINVFEKNVSVMNHLVSS